MRAFVLTVLFLLASRSMALAGDQYSGISLSFSRFAHNNTASLNRILAQQQAGQVPDVRFAYGVSLITQRHGDVISSYDFSLEKGLAAWANGAEYASRLNLFHFFYSLSYALSEGDQFSLYPLLGMGIQSASLELKSRHLKSASIDAVLRGDARDVTISALNAAVKTALRMEFIIARHHAQGVITKIPLGLELAYIQPFFVLSANSLGHAKVSGLPNLEAAGFRLSISVGLRALIKGEAVR